MYLINLRAEGMKGKTFSNDEQITRHEEGSCEEVTEKALLEDIFQRNILVVIHGFNNSMDDILSLYSRIEKECQTFFDASYDAIVGFVWPSGESEFSYFHSKENARRSGGYLQDWLCRFTKAGCTIDLMGHSMATVVGYYAMQSPKQIKVRNIFSFGAAVSQSFLVERLTANMMEKVGRVYLFYTKRDDVLKYWFRLVEWEEAIGYSGLKRYKKIAPYFHQLTLIDCSNIVQTHTGYWESKVVFECISNILNGKQYPRQYKLLPGLRNLFDSFLTSADRQKNKLMNTSG